MRHVRESRNENNTLIINPRGKTLIMCVGQLFRMDPSVPAQLRWHEKRWFCLFTSFFFLFLVLFLKCNTTTTNNNSVLNTKRKEQENI